MGKPIDQRIQSTVKSLIQKVILNISIIAIFISLGIIALAYAGLDFNLATGGIIWKVAVPSIILAISNLMIYELWLRNGSDSARNELEYQTLLQEYDKKSSYINEDIMQEFLDAEKERRYQVEYNKLTQLIERIEKTIATTNKTTRRKFAEKRLQYLFKQRDNINITLPYNRSEQFDELRYTIKDSKFKEYKPNDTQLYLRKKRIKKYTALLTFTLIGLNMLAISAGGSNWLVAIFMTILAAASLLTSLIMGFSNGYTSINVSSTGIYKTAISFIMKAQAYCMKYNKQLYFTPNLPKDDIPDLLIDNKQLESDNVENSQDIFTKAAIIVAGNDN